MVKFFALALAVVGSLAVADLAEARGRRGCSSCSAGGGCPGGVCYAPVGVGPGKMAMTDNAPPAALATSEVPPGGPAVAEVNTTAPRTYVSNNARRGGWFGRRR